MKSKVIVVHADKKPMEGIESPGPHQTYRHPRVAVEIRDMALLDPNELRVEMIYAGLCGTDVHLVEENPATGYIRTSSPAKIPKTGRIIGHEGVGRILEVGANVRHAKAGDYVTFESIIVCHHCDVCRKGNFNQCRNAKLLGLEKDGLFGTVVDVPAMLTHDVSDIAISEKGLQASACVEPAGVAYVACQNTRIAGGDVVVVFGAGPIGLFSAMLSKAIFGASMVHMVEPIEFRRNFARKWCDKVYGVDEFFENCPPSIDVIIEASGDLDNVSKIFQRVNANGRIAFLARSGKPLILDGVDHMITNQVTLTGSRGHLCGAFNDILNLHKQGRIHLDGIITNIVDGPEGLCELLQSTEKILNENCKVLMRLDWSPGG